MAQDIVNQLRDALMPLINESIAAADWNQDEWHTNLWDFEITDGNFCYEYILNSRPGKPGKSPKYLPYIPEPVPKHVEVATALGSYYVLATYRRPTGGTLYDYGAFYNPSDDISLEKWSQQFITAAKMHVAGING